MFRGPDDIDPGFGSWEPDDPLEEPNGSSSWRRPFVVVVAVLAIISLAAVPIYNLIVTDRGRVADNGLEVCAFDYCVVEEAVQAAGLGLEMIRLSNVILDDAEATLLVDAATRHLGIVEVTVRVEDELGGRLGGYFDTGGRVVAIERPANVWIVLHEVAHAVANGHGDEFQAVLIGLARWSAQVGY